MAYPPITATARAAACAGAILTTAPALAQPEPPAATTIAFDDMTPGQPPTGFTTALTGRGGPPTWIVESVEGAHVLAQTSADRTSFRFPLCVLDDVAVTDVDLSVRFQPVSGETDQAAGLVWRYADADNYYVVRANAREDNVVLYKMENGRRSDLKPIGASVFAYGRSAPVPTGGWSTLRVTARGSRFSVYLNGEHLFDIEDETFTDAGGVGVWTKADSVTRFDDLTVAPVED